MKRFREGLYVDQGRASGGGKPADAFKESIRKRRDGSADQKRQRTVKGHQHPNKGDGKVNFPLGDAFLFTLLSSD